MKIPQILTLIHKNESPQILTLIQHSQKKI